MNIRNFAFLFLLFSLQINAQIKKGERFLKKGEYDNAIQFFENMVFSNDADEAVMAEYYLSKVHFTTQFENYDLIKAHEFVNSAIKRYEKLEDKDVKNLQKKDIGILTLQSHKKQIVTAAYVKAKKDNTYKSYQDYLNNYEGPSPVQYDNIVRWRNEQGLQEAQHRGRFHFYENLYQKYRESFAKYNPEDFVTLQKELFESYIGEWTWNSYNTFANRYPDNVYIADSAAAVEYRPIANSKNVEDFKTFLIGFPESPFAKLAKDRIMEIALTEDDIELYDYFIRTFPAHPNSNQLIVKYYHKLLGMQEIKTPADFSKIYPDIPINKILKLEGEK